MRLFIAIDFNEFKDYFVELQSRLPKNVRLSCTRTFHITLKFLGEVQPNIGENIIHILKNIKFHAFSVFLEGIGTFPSENNIRVIWVGIKPEDKILELQKQIDESLKPLFKIEKEFKAHITLARVRYIENKKDFVEQLKRIKVENKKIEIKNFRLINSTLTPKGAVYENLMVFEGE